MQWTRCCGLVLALALAACERSAPTAVRAPTAPRFDAAAVGSSATWFFEGAVAAVYPPSTARVGQQVKGSMTFTFTSADVLPDDPCRSYQWVKSSVSFTLDGVPVTASGDWGQALVYGTCAFHTDYAWVQVNVLQAPYTYQLELRSPVDTQEFPLVAPPLAGWPNLFSWWNSTAGNGGVRVELTKLYSGPQAKADCLNDGWQKFGFKNQGQCIRYVETGKDSR